MQTDLTVQSEWARKWHMKPRTETWGFLQTVPWKNQLRAWQQSEKIPKQTSQTEKLERRQAQNRKVFFTELVRPVEHLLKADPSNLYESKRKTSGDRKTPELLQVLKSSRGKALWGKNIVREKHRVHLGCPCLRHCLIQQDIRWVLGINQFSHSHVLNLTLILRTKICSFSEQTQKSKIGV